MRRSCARRVLVAALFVLLLPFAAGCRRKGTDWRVTQLYGGPGSAQALTAPIRVQAYRISPKSHAPEAGVAYVGVHRVTAGPVELESDVAARLSAILSDPGTYDWRRAKSDPYLPTIGLRFTRDVSRVDIALDFSCDMLTIYRHGKRTGFEDFDDARAQLLAVLKPLFPEDADVQSLE
jgi:hypothetical protein